MTARIRPLAEADLHAADQVFRLAFGTVPGVAMQKPNAPAFNRPGLYVLDDWR